MINRFIATGDYQGLEQALTNDPELANEGLPYDELNTAKAPPLHRLCDAVFSEIINDEEATLMAKIFLKYGAKINGGQLIEKQDSPLVAASSLHADGLAFLYINSGAEINHAGTHGGTALHWAAWCGRDKLVKRLVEAGSELNKKCIDFKATPLYWAVHGLKRADNKDLQEHLACVEILINAGADKNIPDADGKTIFDLVEDKDSELKKILN